MVYSYQPYGVFVPFGIIRTPNLAAPQVAYPSLFNQLPPPNSQPTAPMPVYVSSVQGQPVPLAPELKQLASYVDYAFSPSAKANWNQFISRLNADFKAGRIVVDGINDLTQYLKSLEEINVLAPWLNLFAINEQNPTAQIYLAEMSLQASFIDEMKRRFAILNEIDNLAKGSEEDVVKACKLLNDEIDNFWMLSENKASLLSPLKGAERLGKIICISGMQKLSTSIAALFEASLNKNVLSKANEFFKNCADTVFEKQYEDSKTYYYSEFPGLYRSITCIGKKLIDSDQPRDDDNQVCDPEVASGDLIYRSYRLTDDPKILGQVIHRNFICFFQRLMKIVLDAEKTPYNNLPVPLLFAVDAIESVNFSEYAHIDGETEKPDRKHPIEKNGLEISKQGEADQIKISYRLYYSSNYFDCIKALIEIVFTKKSGSEEAGKLSIKCTFASDKKDERANYLLTVFERLGILTFDEPIQHHNQKNSTLCSISIKSEKDAKIAIGLLVAIAQNFNTLETIYQLAVSFGFESKLSRHLFENGSPFATKYYAKKIESILTDYTRPKQKIPLVAVIFANLPYTKQLLKWIHVLARKPGSHPAEVINESISKGELQEFDKELFSRFINLDAPAAHDDILTTIKCLLRAYNLHDVCSSIVKTYFAYANIGTPYYDDSLRPISPFKKLEEVVAVTIFTANRDSKELSKQILLELVKRGYALDLAEKFLLNEWKEVKKLPGYLDMDASTLMITHAFLDHYMKVDPSNASVVKVWSIAAKNAQIDRYELVLAYVERGLLLFEAEKIIKDRLEIDHSRLGWLPMMRAVFILTQIGRLNKISADPDFQALELLRLIADQSEKVTADSLSQFYSRFKFSGKAYSWLLIQGWKLILKKSLPSGDIKSAIDQGLKFLKELARDDDRLALELYTEIVKRKEGVQALIDNLSEALKASSIMYYTRRLLKNVVMTVTDHDDLRLIDNALRTHFDSESFNSKFRNVGRNNDTVNLFLSLLAEVIENGHQHKIGLKTASDAISIMRIERSSEIEGLERLGAVFSKHALDEHISVYISALLAVAYVHESSGFEARRFLISTLKTTNSDLLADDTIDLLSSNFDIFKYNSEQIIEGLNDTQFKFRVAKLVKKFLSEGNDYYIHDVLAALAEKGLLIEEAFRLAKEHLKDHGNKSQAQILVLKLHSMGQSDRSIDVFGQDYNIEDQSIAHACYAAGLERVKIRSMYSLSFKQEKYRVFWLSRVPNPSSSLVELFLQTENCHGEAQAYADELFKSENESNRQEAVLIYKMLAKKYRLSPTSSTNLERAKLDSSSAVRKAAGK